MLTSVTERDHLVADCADSASPLDTFAAALTEAGLHIKRHRPATAADVEALGSTWAKRLGIPARRPAWLLVARK